MPESARVKRGSKIEGRGTRAPLRDCLHMGLRGTAAQEGSAATPRKRLWIKELSGAAYSQVRSHTPGAYHDPKS